MTIAACLVIPTISSAAYSISNLELLVGLGDVAGVHLGVVLPSYMVVHFQLRTDLHDSPVEAGIALHSKLPDSFPCVVRNVVVRWGPVGNLDIWGNLALPIRLRPFPRRRFLLRNI